MSFIGSAHKTTIPRNFKCINSIINLIIARLKDKDLSVQVFLKLGVMLDSCFFTIHIYSRVHDTLAPV